MNFYMYMYNYTNIYITHSPHQWPHSSLQQDHLPQLLRHSQNRCSWWMAPDLWWSDWCCWFWCCWWCCLLSCRWGHSWWWFHSVVRGEEKTRRGWGCGRWLRLWSPGEIHWELNNSRYILYYTSALFSNQLNSPLSFVLNVFRVDSFLPTMFLTTTL